MEGLIHPRAGQAALQQRSAVADSRSMQPETAASGDALTALGVPKLWSALAPVSHAAAPPRTSPTGQAAATETAASATAAREVLKAGQVYAAAVAKLEASLTQDGGAQAVTDAASPSAAMPRQQQDGSGIIPKAAQQGPTHTAQPAADTVNEVSSSIPVGSLDAPQAAWPDNSTAVPLQPTVPGAKPSRLPEALLQAQPVASAAAERDAAVGITENDGSLSLGHEAISSSQNASMPLPQPTQPAATASAYLSAAAESSDSQGSLPEIDSGQSSSSSEEEQQG